MKKIYGINIISLRNYNYFLKDAGPQGSTTSYLNTLNVYKFLGIGL